MGVKDEKPGTIRIGMSMPRELEERLKREALRQCDTVSGVMRRFCLEGLNRSEKLAAEIDPMYPVQSNL